jgi:hypothetical protein
VSFTLNGDASLRARLLLSVQRAMLGEVTPNIRAVTCRIDSTLIILRWIIDGPVSEKLKDNLSIIGTEVVSDFSSHRISEEFVRRDVPADIKTLYLDDLVHLRKE